jgi:WhiB family redox-sensing transcriptional regulator
MAAGSSKADGDMWREFAACLAEDPDLFFPEGSGPASQAQAAEAKAICRGCPVRKSCLQWALRVGLQHGVWGGLTVDERTALRRRTDGPVPAERVAPDSAVTSR